MSSSRPLFNKVDILSVQQHQQEKAKEAVRQLSIEKLNENDDALAAEIATTFTLDVPVIDESGIYQTDRQVQIDARRLPN